MSIEKKDSYFVAVKMFLEHEGKLFIFKDRFGDWDLPGGRMTKDEFETPLEDILRRKIREELGEEVQYTLKGSPIFMRHERIEAVPGNPTVRIFAVGYPAVLQSGDIQPTEQHPEILWIDPRDFQPQQYFKGGWLKGVQEYLEQRL